MTECQHAWKMTDIRFGFTVYELCSHCKKVRTYYSTEGTWDAYREGTCIWNIVENAQCLRFNLECEQCHEKVDLEDLRGLMYCTSCMEDCEVERQRKALEPQKTWVLVALPHHEARPVSEEKLTILTDYFNQRRDTSISKVKIIGDNGISEIPVCRGEFIRDVGMLSKEPVNDRPPLI